MIFDCTRTEVFYFRERHNTMCEPAPCKIYYVVVVIVVVPTTYITTGVACPRKAGLFIKQLEPSYYIILPTSILVQMYLYRRCYTYIIYMYISIRVRDKIMFWNSHDEHTIFLHDDRTNWIFSFTYEFDYFRIQKHVYIIYI